jgi:hypothetical protein
MPRLSARSVTVSKGTSSTSSACVASPRLKASVASRICLRAELSEIPQPGAGRSGRSPDVHPFAQYPLAAPEFESTGVHPRLPPCIGVFLSRLLYRLLYGSQPHSACWRALARAAAASLPPSSVMWL